MRGPPLALCALLLGACAQPELTDERFDLRLRALSTRDEPLAGARFWADGRDLGTTTPHGELRAELRGRAGAALQLRAACPIAYRTLEPERQLVLRRMHAAAGQSAAADIELALSCEPLERQAALVVLASGPGSAGLRVRVDGTAIGQTAADGSAHLLVSAAPHATLRVELDTSGVAAEPRNPVHSFRLEDDDSILLVEQAFAAPQATGPAGPRRQAPARSQRKPQRIR